MGFNPSSASGPPPSLKRCHFVRFVGAIAQKTAPFPSQAMSCTCNQIIARKNLASLLPAKMVASTNLIISCNFSCLPLKVNPKPKSLLKTHYTSLLFSNTSTRKGLNISNLVKPPYIYNNKKGVLQTCYSTLNSDNKSPDDQVLDKDAMGGGKEGGRDWTTSILLFVFWGGLIYYVFNLTPDQTPVI